MTPLIVQNLSHPLLRAYSPSEPKTSLLQRTLSWWKDKKDNRSAPPSQPSQVPPIMSSGTGVQQMAEANNVLGRQLRYNKNEAFPRLNELMQDPEKNKSDIDHLLGQLKAFNQAEQYHADC